jgi:ubiquinone/menaquinone biosynthesis C-methylase UbiE
VTALEDPNTKARRVWDKTAPRYDRDIAFWEKVQFGGGREWVASRVTGEVLEVAVGTGRNLDFYPPGVTITGIELSPAMLAIAQQHAADLAHDAVRVLRAGGQLLLLDHVASTWPPIYGLQWLVERFTIRAAGEHMTRRQLPLLQAAGFEIVETQRLKAGTVERIAARKPVTA